MKKLSVIVLVALLCSMVTYGGEWEPGSGKVYVDPISTKVGIGVISPLTNLHVQYSLATTHSDPWRHSVIYGYNTATSYDPVGVFGRVNYNNGKAIYGHNENSNGYGGYFVGKGYFSGNVGIGATNPSSKLQVDFNSGTSLTGTSAFAGIHLKPGNDNDDFVGITADAPYATGEVTQAGMLFQGSGMYGTKIHFLTTDSFAIGMKQRMIIDHHGNVGIDTTSPGGYKLNVNGNIFSNGTITFPTVTYGGTESITALSFPQTGDGVEFISQQLENDISQFIIKLSDNTANDALKIWFDDYRGEEDDRYPLEVRGDRVLLVQDGGKVGIGTTDPGNYKLAVNGHIRTKEITVETGWSDFVFEDNYQLMPLDKLEKHIKEEKSLPGIPTEEEVLKDGVKVGKMQAKLLEKVEELTLYVIELKKENEKLQKRIDALEN
jgi:hypothetical protein